MLDGKFKDKVSYLVKLTFFLINQSGVALPDDELSRKKECGV